MDWLTLLVVALAVDSVVTKVLLYRLRAENRRLSAQLRALGYAVLLGVGVPPKAQAFPQLPHVHAYARTQTHPDAAVVDILVFLETKVPKEEWCFWRFFHWLPIADDDLPDELGNFKCYLQMLNGTAPGPVRPIPIDKAGRVWGVDRREAGWSAAAFHAVAVLDNTCREPNVDPQLAAELRRAVGVEREDSKYPHVEGLVPGYWFVREVEETNRHKNDPENIAYYNLLYSRERFGDDFESVLSLTPSTKADARESKAPAFRKWNGVVNADKAYIVDERKVVLRELHRGDGFQVTNPSEGGYVYGVCGRGRNGTPPTEGYILADLLTKTVEERAPAGRTSPAHGNGFIDRDFPKNADQFRERWGVQAAIDFQNKQRVFKFNGTIIAGAFNDPKTGSVVSDNDRVNRFLAGPLGLAMETNDFLFTAGRKNIVNNPLGVALDDIDEDASEKIYQKQDDWPVFWLNGAKKDGAKRVEFGDPDVVHDKINGGKVTVQTLHKCVGCHYPNDVVLAPSNEKFVAGLKRQQELFAKSKGGQLVIDKFFFDGDAVGEGWRWKLDGWRIPFRRSLAFTTRSVKEPKGWPGTKLASVSNSRRDWYDLPIKRGQAAAELGVSELALMVVCLTLNDFDAGQLFLNDEDWPGVPRAQWDAELLPKLAYVLALARDLDYGQLYAPGFNTLFPEYTRGPTINPRHN